MTEQTEQEKKANTAPPPPEKPGLRAAFNRYDSPFLQLVAPLVATRYFWLAVEEINPRNFLRKPNPAEKEGFTPWEKPSAGRYLSYNFAAFGMGLTFLSIVGLYSRNTLHDIKSLYAEAVGYELGKKKEDVTLSDVFLKSKNAAVSVTCKAYLKRTLVRIATAATFFIPWHKLRDFKDAKPKYDANANVGVGAIGAYLYWEGFMRQPSFFDAEQKMVSNRISNNSPLAHGEIPATEIESLLWLQRKHLNKSYQWPDATSEEGRQDRLVARRIADLMNQTYHDKAKTEYADFTVGKLNYLIGFGLLDKHPESMAFVELANRSADMSEVKRAAAMIHAGQPSKEVFAQFGLEEKPVPLQPVQSAGVDPPEKRPVKFTTQEQPRTYQDFAAQTSIAARTV